MDRRTTKVPYELGQQLREERKRQGIVQVDIAKKLSMSQGDYSRLELRGDHLMSTFVRWADALGYELRLVRKK